MLNEIQIKQYQDQGYVLVNHLFSSQELDRLECEFDGILERRERHKVGQDATWAGDWQKEFGKTSICFAQDVQAYSAQWSRFLLQEKLTESMADLIGPNVQFLNKGNILALFIPSDCIEDCNNENGNGRETRLF